MWSGLCCLQIESLDTTECFNSKPRLVWYFAHAQDDVKPHILHMFEGTFSLATARFTPFYFYYCFFPFNRAWYLIWLFPKKKIHLTLWKQAYSNILNILTIKKWKFSDKNLSISHTSGQNIDCGYSLEPHRWGGSNKYPQSMFWGRNKKNNVHPCKPQFYYIKVGFKGVNII